MLLGAGVDQVDLEVGELVVVVAAAAAEAAGQVPKVDVVGAQVLERPQGAGDGAQVLGRGGEGGALEDQEGGLGVDGAVEGGSSSGLVCLFIVKVGGLDRYHSLDWAWGFVAHSLRTLVEEPIQFEPGD